MSDGNVTQQTPTVFSSKERATLVAKALSEAARRARFSTKRRRGLTQTGFRARRSERLFKLLRAATFVGFVLLPSLVAAGYLWAVASDQYISEARFTLRGGMPPIIDRIGALTGAPTAMIVQDTQVVMNYIQSRAAVDALNRTVGLQKLYDNADIDWFSRLGRGEPIEKVTRYWKSHVDLSVTLPSGIVTFRVRAFTADDAVALANAALQSSERLVNEMNDQMRGDAVSLAEKERLRAQDNLAHARAVLERVRNEEGILSASATSHSLDDIIVDLKGNLSRLQQQYDSQLRFVDANAPQMRSLHAKVTAAANEVKKVENQITSTNGGVDPDTGGKVLSGSMSRLDYANLETTIAEKLYAGSLAALEQAKLASETKLMYINVFVHPVPAEESKYPQRWLVFSLVVGAGLGTWLIGLGLLTLVRSRMA